LKKKKKNEKRKTEKNFLLIKKIEKAKVKNYFYEIGVKRTTTKWAV